MRRRFSSVHRLRRRSAFIFLKRSGRRFVFGPLSIQYFLEDSSTRDRSFSKLGITISKKHGSSVERNQFKRRVREVYRLSGLIVIKGLIINVSANTHLPIPFAMIQKALHHFEQRIQEKAYSAGGTLSCSSIPET